MTIDNDPPEVAYIGPDRRHETRRQGFVGRFAGRLWWLIAYSDTTPTRHMLAWIAVCWAVMLAWPGDTVTRPVYVIMAELVGDHGDFKWSAAWAVAAVGMFWRVFATHPRPLVALILNSYYFLLYTIVLTAIFLTRPFPLPAAMAADLVCLFASGWVLVRTHVNSGAGWRRD